MLKLDRFSCSQKIWLKRDPPVPEPLKMPCTSGLMTLKQEPWQVPAAPHLGWSAAGHASSPFTVTLTASALQGRILCPPFVFPIKFWHQIGKYNISSQT